MTYSRTVQKIIISLLMVAAGFGYSYGKKVPHTGIGIRGSAFGIPNRLLDLLIYEHPEIKGQSYSFEIRSYGSKGPKGIFSGLYSLEYSKMSGEGPWRDEQDHRRLDGKGEITQVSLTATIIMSIFPRSPVHIYIGGGLGIGKISIWYEGTYTDELGTEIKEKYEENRIIPVAHVPVGIAFNFKNKTEFRIEGGFKNGFYVGAGIVFNF
jgi:opacity protein-like surface antigen